jgi:glycosyltransferase involved in cell wall biosynthesis
MRDELGCPVICSVQGEDLFLEQLAPPYREQVQAKLRERAADVAGFIATSRYYAEHMGRLLQIPAERMHCVALGVSLEGLAPRPPGAAAHDAANPFVVGFLARACPEKGLHLLADAFRQLAGAVGPERVRLRIAGWAGERDRPFRQEVLDDLARHGLGGIVDCAGELDREHKAEFLRSLDVLSVPTVYHEPKGLFVLEALACGVPVVEPRHGAFPELLEATGGGLLVEPDSPRALAEALRGLCERPEEAARLGQRGHASLAGRYDDATMARRTVEVYERYLGG